MCIENKKINLSEDYPEYKMPEDIRALISDEFLKEFRRQLFRIYDYLSLETFYDFGISNLGSTGGWQAAFGKACLLTNNEKLLNYWRKLDWDDSELFDWELEKALLDRKLILGNSDEVLGKLLNIDPADIICCCDCNKFFAKDMTIIVPEDDEDYIDDEGYIQYRCLHCQDVKEAEKNTENINPYYELIKREIKEYSAKHPINEGKIKEEGEIS